MVAVLARARLRRSLPQRNPMRWDDPIFTGSHDGWQWIVVREMIRDLPILVAQCHIGNRLCIAAFDSGPISPSPEEYSIGWTLKGDVMISPPIVAETDIPCAEHDEWYIFPEVPHDMEISQRYVNYFGFTLADAFELASSQDPTRDRTNYDWLVTLQLDFWRNLKRLNPISYVSSGDYDIIVTKNPRFAETVLSAAKAMMG